MRTTLRHSLAVVPVPQEFEADENGGGLVPSMSWHVANGSDGARETG